MTSVKPGLVDANVLVHAFDTEAPQHLASRNLLETAWTGATTLPVTSQMLCEFYAILTNRRLADRGRDAGQWRSAYLHLQHRDFKPFSEIENLTP